MDTVTYPDAQVADELTRWIFLRLDITKHRQAAELFEVAAVPAAIAAAPDGTELGRLENFIEPAAFRERLESLRRKPSR